MKKLLLSVFTVVFTLSTSSVWAQCTGNTQSGTFCTRAPNGNAPDGVTPYLHSTLLPNAGCGVFANSSSNFGPGQYFQVPVLAGGCYSFSTCGSTTNANFQLSAFQGTNATTPFAYGSLNTPTCISNPPTVNIVPNFTDYTRVQVREPGCAVGGTSSITVRVRQNNNLVITSSSVAMCEGQTRTLTATPVPVGGTLIPGSGDRGTFTSSGGGISGSTFTAPTPSGTSQTYIITYTFGYCTTTQNITVYRKPTTASAGPDQNICGTSATLAANDPTLPGGIGTGIWTLVSGTATIASPTSPTSTVNLTSNSATFRWTITNGTTCAASTDDVVIKKDVTPPVINCPADISTSAATGQCGKAVPYNVTASDACGTTPSLVSGGASGSFFPVGTTTVIWSAQDPSGNQSSCSFEIEVIDHEIPTIICPADINVISTTASCSAPVSFTPPVGADNCAVSTALTAGYPPGLFPGGTTVVTYTATDASGNTGSCSFNVTVDPIPNGTLTLAPSPICLGNQTTLTFDFTSGVGPFNVVITDGVNNFTVNGVNDGGTYNVTPPTTVTYSYVSIQDASGCTRTSNFGGTAQVIVTPLPNVSFSGLNSVYCETSGAVTLSGSQNGGTFSGVGVTNLGGGQGEFNPSAAGPTGPYNVTYAFTDINGCSDSEVQVVSVDEQPIANAGAGGSECDLNFTFSAVPSVGIGTWTLVSGPGVPFFSNINVATSIVQVSVPGTYIFRWTEVNGLCSDFDEISVVFYQVPTANAGFGGGECDLDFQLGATPSVGTGTWTASGPGSATYAPNANAPNAVATVNNYGNYVFTWTENNGGCTNSASINVSFDELPVANAGTGGNVCGLNFTFSAVPTVGSGKWTVSGPGGASFTSATNATTPVTVTNYGTYIFTWTETNGNCSSSDDVIVNFYQQPVANPGADADVCSLNHTLGATPSAGSGVWTYTGSGIATFANPTSATSAVSVDLYGAYNFTWTETNGTCSDAASVLVNFFEQPTANAGTGGNECDLDFALNAVPSAGVGLWTATGPGAATFTNDLDPTSNVTVSNYGTYTFTWTEISGTCSDAASVTVNFYEEPTANAGTGGDECDLTFLTNAVASVGTGLWSQTGGLGTATFSNAAAAMNIITVDAYGTYEFTWTETNGTCTDSRSMTVNFYEPPVANAGTGGVECDMDFVFSAVLSTGTGQWTSSGPGTATFVDDTDPNTTATVSQSGVYTFTWTESNGTCVDTDVVQVQFYDQPVANAGVGGDECDLNFNLNAVTSFGTGTWTYAGAGNAYFSNPNNPAATVVVDTYGAYTFTWTEVNGSCSDNASVIVNFYQQPVANAGIGGSECDLDFVLNGTPSVGIGQWTYIGTGTATFTPSDADANATVTVDAAGSYTFTWTEDNNGCTDSDDVTVVFNTLPVVSFTGLDVQYCIDQTTPVLLVGSPTGGVFSGLGISGNSFVPSIAGVGTIFITYTYTDGNGCTNTETQSVDVNGLPTVSFSGLAAAYCEDDATPYTLTGSPAGGTFSGLGISGNDFVPSNSIAGINTITYIYTDPFGCSNSTQQQVTINKLPVVSFTGLASSYCENASNAPLVGSPSGGTFSGTGIIGSAFSATAAGTGVYTITYTYTDGNGCTNSQSQTVTVNDLPVPVITPSGTAEICAGSSMVLDAGSGYSVYNWSNGTNGQTTTVSQAGTYTVIVTTAGGCSGTSAPVQVFVNQPPVVDLGSDTTICTASSLTLDAGNAGSSYSWSTQEISQSITVTTTGAYTVQVTDQNGCVGSDNISVTVSNLLNPTIVADGPVQFCAGGAVGLNAGSGYDSYQWSTGETTQNITVSTSGVVGLQVWDEFGCSGLDEVIVSLMQLPNATISPSGTVSICNGDTATLSANGGFTTYTWNPSSQTSQTIDVWQAGTYTVTVQDPNNGCSNTSAPVQVVVNTTVPPTIVPSGPTQFCAGGSVSLTVEPGPYTSYLWCSGSTTPSIVVTQSGDYCVTVLDANGCLDATLTGNPLHVEVWNPHPVAEQQGDSIVVTNGPFGQYQWYFNGAPLPGATSSIIVPAASGNYYVVAWDDNDCSGNSYNVEFTHTGIADLTSLYQVEVYPNPATEQFTLVADFGKSTTVTLIVSDITGREIMKPEIIENTSSIRRTFDVRHLDSGIYHIRLVTNDGVAIKKLIRR